MAKESNILLRIDAKKKEKFMSKCVMARTTMTMVLTAAIDEFLNKGKKHRGDDK